MEPTRLKSRKIMGHNKWASKCKLSQGEDFAAKLGELRFGNDTKGTDKEMEELQSFFQSGAPIMTGDAALAATFALHALGAGLAPQHKAIDSVDRIAAKFAMKLKNRTQARRAEEILVGDGTPTAVDGYASFPAALACTSIAASTSFVSDASAAKGPTSPPRKVLMPAEPLQLPGIPVRPRQSSSVEEGGQAPWPRPQDHPPAEESCDSSPKGLHDPISPSELHAALAPVPMTVRDFQVMGAHTPRRPSGASGSRGPRSRTHYDYFAHCLPDESPVHRRAMRHRVAIQRQACSPAAGARH